MQHDRLPTIINCIVCALHFASKRVQAIKRYALLANIHEVVRVSELQYRLAEVGRLII